ncbi:hypothetical protein C0995_004073 [Termitomyces sp. Mi166|nr:hypothetical protein C0995_004073 [Termitomyces sp. Mi166\
MPSKQLGEQSGSQQEQAGEDSNIEMVKQPASLKHEEMTQDSLSPEPSDNNVEDEFKPPIDTEANVSAADLTHHPTPTTFDVPDRDGGGGSSAVKKRILASGVLDVSRSVPPPAALMSTRPSGHPVSPTHHRKKTARKMKTIFFLKTASQNSYARTLSLDVCPPSDPDWLPIRGKVTAAWYGGTAGRGITYTHAKQGRKHVFLSSKNCPRYSAELGDLIYFFIGHYLGDAAQVTVFLHYATTYWTYAGEYECRLMPLGKADFRVRDSLTLAVYLSSALNLMVTVSPINEIAFLRDQNRLLEEELADVKRELDAFRQELSYYREKAAKYISMADEHGSTIRDLERELKRTQNRLVSPGTQPSLQEIIDVVEEQHDTEISILVGAPAITSYNVSAADQHASENLKRSSGTAQLQNQDDLPTKRLRIQSLDLDSPVDETQETPHEDRAAKEGVIISNDVPECHSPSHDIGLDSISQLNIEVDIMSESRSPSTSHATNVILSPEIPRVSHIATERSVSHDLADVQHRATSAVAETSLQDLSLKATDSYECPETDPKPSQLDAASVQKLSWTKLMDTEQPRDHPSPAEISSLLSDFKSRRPFQIRPPPKWTSECENVTSLGIRRLLGGLTGPGATFTKAKEGRTHLFLQRGNCPSLPLPGEPSVVYVGFPNHVNPDVTVFIHRGLRKGDAIWEYGGEYECILKLLNPRDFKKESTRFREDFVGKYLFEKEFQSRYVNDPGRLQQPSISTRDAELRAIDNGDKCIFLTGVASLTTPQEEPYSSGTCRFGENRYLEKQLAEVTEEREAFRKELAYYRGKTAKYISLSEKHDLKVRDLARQLERNEQLAKMDEAVLGSVLRASETPKQIDKHTHRKESTDMIDQVKPRNLLEFPETRLSEESATVVAEERDDRMSISDSASLIARFEVSRPHQETHAVVDPPRKRSGGDAELHDEDHRPAKKHKSQLLGLSDPTGAARSTPHEDRSADEWDGILNDSESHSPLRSTKDCFGPQLDKSASRSPSVGQATNVTPSPEIPSTQEIARANKGISHVNEEIQHVITSPVAEVTLQTPFLKTKDPRRHPTTTSSASPLPYQETSSTQFEDNSERAKWTPENENITSHAVRFVLGGTTGPGATFTASREGHKHLFLMTDNCPRLPLPGDPAMFYVAKILVDSELSGVMSTDVRVFIQRRGSSWEYGGEYRCTLRLMSPEYFRKEADERTLFEESFRSRATPGYKEWIQHVSVLEIDAELQAIGNGEKVS